METSPANAKVELWWADANTNANWPTDWTKVGETSASGVAPGGSLVVTIPWFVSTPNSSGTPHYCLIARIVETPGDKFHATETGVVWSNVSQNNNIAWRNTTPVDNIANKQGPSRQIVAFTFSATPGSDGQLGHLRIQGSADMLADGIGVTLDLGDQLEVWLAHGATLQNAQRVGHGLLRITSLPAAINGLELAPEAIYEGTFEFDLSRPVPNPGTQRGYSLDVRSLMGETPIGGLSITVSARALDADSDRDGIPDITDTDDDADGRPDGLDASPLDSRVQNPGPRAVIRYEGTSIGTDESLTMPDAIVGQPRTLVLVVENIGTQPLVVGDTFQLPEGFLGTFPHFVLQPGRIGALSIVSNADIAGTFRGPVEISTNDPGMPRISFQIQNTVRNDYARFSTPATTAGDFQDLYADFQSFLPADAETVVFDTNLPIENELAYRGVSFPGTDLSMLLSEDDPNSVESLDGFNGTFRPDGSRILARTDNHLQPLVIEFADPVSAVGRTGT